MHTSGVFLGLCAVWVMLSFVLTCLLLCLHSFLQVLPPHLGGTGQLIPVQDGWQRVLKQREQQAAQQPATLCAGGGCSQDAVQEQHEVQAMASQMRLSGPNGADAAVLIHALDG